MADGTANREEVDTAAASAVETKCTGKRGEGVRRSAAREE